VRRDLGVANLAPSPHLPPPEQAAPSIVAAFFTEFIPNVKNEYELLKRASEGPLKISLFDLEMETLIFGLHCLDRAVFAHHGAAYRSDFMDCAFATASEAFSAALPDPAKDQFLESFQDHCYVRIQEYSAMKLLPGDDGALKGVLSWEYAKSRCFDADVVLPEALLVMSEQANSIFSMMNRIAQTL
jgi:hypothetical protein